MLRPGVKPAQFLPAFAPLFLLAIVMLFWRLSSGSRVPRQGYIPQPEIVRAVEQGQTDRVRALLESGVSADTGRTVYHYPPGTGNERNRFAPTPLLQIAARNKNLALVRLLLERGADPNARGPYDYTALHLAAGNGDPTMVRLLLERRANPNIHESIRNETPLHRAILGNFRRNNEQGQANRAEVIRLLLQAGADKSAPDRNGVTPVEHARQRNETQLLAAFVPAQSSAGVH